MDCFRQSIPNLGMAQVYNRRRRLLLSFMRTGFAPATIRRNRVEAVGRQLNPFPLVQLPITGLFNPWTWGVMHLCSQHLQTDWGLSKAVPSQRGAPLTARPAQGRPVAAKCGPVNREMFAGHERTSPGRPEVVVSLMD